MEVIIGIITYGREIRLTVKNADSDLPLLMDFMIKNGISLTIKMPDPFIMLINYLPSLLSDNIPVIFISNN